MATQDLYADTADPAVVAFLNGKSSLIMAYGATGSGKTHTLHGPSSASSCSIHPHHASACHQVHPLAGVAPRACAAALTALQRRRRIARARGVVQPQLYCSYVQVYGNDVTDLLEGGGQQSIGAWGGVAAAAIAQGAAEVNVTDAAHLQQVSYFTRSNYKPRLLTYAAAAPHCRVKQAPRCDCHERAQQVTGSIPHSNPLSHACSRAHSILTLRMTHPLHERPPSRLVIADLGGCERVAQVQLLLSCSIYFDARHGAALRIAL